jgi:hypothetical protein
MQKIKKKTVIKILISLFAIIAVIVSVLTIPSAECDYKVFGDDYKYHLYDKYRQDLQHNIVMANLVYDEDIRAYDGYYDDEKLSMPIPADKEGKDKVISYDGRKLYITVSCEYNGKNIDITFEGTKIIADVYSWKMVKNELFPFDDSSLELLYEMEYA